MNLASKLALFALILLSGACASATPTPSRRPAATIFEPTPTPKSTSSSWLRKAPGVEYTLIEAHAEQHREWLLLVRLDPARITLRVAYDPNLPRTVRQWQQISSADVVINGGFFDDQNRTTGLLIADGRSFGRSYRGFGGMLAWREGAPLLIWLRTTPYRPDPRVTQAVQSFPMLVMDGAPVDGLPEEGIRHRRSFVAIDREGRLIFGVTQRAQWRLQDLATYLAQSDLGVWRALNLDGGGSSGLWLSNASAPYAMDSITPVPSVVMVWAQP
ncbi:MAG: phosphodiester glycosidase family protein [Thermoflexales bacterium]|nr:phosphodiester glycosidase family protein [Thermoflexales bacterium]